jgi:peroxin-19
LYSCLLIGVIFCQVVQSMLTQEALLSPLKERDSQYNRFLRTRGASLPPSDLAQYKGQHRIVQDLCRVLESDPHNVSRVLNLMQALQDAGEPPLEML